MATTRSTAQKLRRILGLTEGQAGCAAVFLGADFAPGVARRRWIRRSRRRERHRRIALRSRRLRRLRAVAGPRARLVAAAGLAPQGGYGAEITGVSNIELKSLRRSLAAAAGPKAGGRSLTAVLLLEGDDAWRAATAPIARWAAEVWAAGCGFVGGLSLRELRCIWVAATQSLPTSWCSAKGPVGAAHLSAKRIAWTWPDPFRFRTAEGHDILLLDVAPSMVLAELRKASLRTMECELAHSLRVRGGWQGENGGDLRDRVSLGAVMKITRSQKAPLEPRQRGCLLAVAAGALWTQSRLCDAGYITSPHCPLCKSAEDTEFHRWWQCPASEHLRLQLTSEAMRLRAAAAGARSLLYARGIVEHPCTRLVAPAQDFMAELAMRADDGNWHTTKDMAMVVTEFDGKPHRIPPFFVPPKVPAEFQMPSVSVFIDGSCTTEDIAEVRRAAWALVWTDDRGAALGKLSGAVPACFPQTPQAAEYLGGLVAATVAGAGQAVLSDCAGVVHHFKDLHGSAQLSPRLRYSGVVRRARAGAGWDAAVQMQKVKAHVNISSSMAQEALFRARGNDAADAAAKSALARHPRDLPAVRSAWNMDWADACTTARLIAAAGPLWPSARPPAGTKLARAHVADASARATAREDARRAEEARRAANFASHVWGQLRGIRRCLRCHVWESHHDAAAGKECQGDWGRSILEGPAASSHDLMCASVYRAGEGNTPLLICMCCGAWMETGFSPRLAEPCRRRFASKSAEYAVQRIRRGQFPKPGASARGALVDDLVPTKKGNSFANFSPNLVISPSKTGNGEVR